MVRILYIIERIGAGGTEKQLTALICGFRHNPQIETHICTLRPSGHLLASVPAPKIELNIRRLFSPYTILQCIRLARYCRRNKINLIQTFFQDPTLVGAFLRILLPVNLLVSFRDLGFWRNTFENLKMRLAYRVADGYIANSMAVKKHFVQTDSICPEKIKVIHNGIEHCAPALKLNNPESCGDPIVGIVGNFNRRVKRIGDFIEAVPLIKEECKNARFYVIGDGNQKLALMQRCAELGVADAVVFTGRIDDPIKIIREFTVGVSTSESEGFSNSVIEYMACGLPVVVTDVGGNREMVTEGINGFRVPVGDINTMANRVIELLKNHSLRQQIGKNNIILIHETYTMNKMIKAHEKYYNAKIMEKLSQC